MYVVTIGARRHIVYLESENIDHTTFQSWHPTLCQMDRFVQKNRKDFNFTLSLSCHIASVPLLNIDSFAPEAAVT